MKYDPHVERKADLIRYHIQTNESICLSDKSLHDLNSNVRDVAGYWKKELDEMHAANYAMRWNELRLWLKRTKPEGYEVILKVMVLLDDKESIRNLQCTDVAGIVQYGMQQRLEREILGGTNLMGK